MTTIKQQFGEHGVEMASAPNLHELITREVEKRDRELGAIVHRRENKKAKIRAILDGIKNARELVEELQAVLPDYDAYEERVKLARDRLKAQLASTEAAR